jgi:hypothetical protein
MPPVISKYRSVRQTVADLIPEPDQNIVKRLISYSSNPNFSIRLPFETTPYQNSYNVEDVKFFARILTMLKDLGIFPPPILKAQGGVVPSRILQNTFEGPTLFTPEAKSSQRYLAVPTSSEEIKANALSNEPGGLADAAEAQVPEIEWQGRDQVIELETVWTRSRQRNEPFSPNPLPNEDEFKEPRGEVDLNEFDDVDLDIFLDERVSEPRPNNPAEEEIFEEPFEMNIIRRTSTWSETIRRRLRWTRISSRRQQEIELELSPPFSISDDDLEEQDLMQPVPQPSISWWSNMSPEVRQRRYNYIKWIAAYLLIPITVIYGSSALLLHKNLQTVESDPLLLLYYKLSVNNWFRANFTALDWVYIFTRTPRPNNYKFIGFVISGVLNFVPEDVVVCWTISKYIVEQNTTSAITWFTILQTAILFRGMNPELVTRSQTLFTGFEYAYILQGMIPNSRLLLSAFWDSKFPATTQLLEAVKRAKKDVKYESKTTERTETFGYLAEALALVLQNTTETEFSNTWTKEMLSLYHDSYFYETFTEGVFQQVLFELCVHPELYPASAKEKLSDFLYRFDGRAGMDLVSPFNDIDSAMKFKEDVSPFVNQLLTACDHYRNDGPLDHLTYDIFNKHLKKYSSSKVFNNFGECIQSLPLPADYPAREVLMILSSIVNGVEEFRNKIQNELQNFTNLENVPEELKSVKLFNNGIDSNQYFQHTRALAPHSRRLLSDDNNVELLNPTFTNFDLLSIAEGPGYLLGAIAEGLFIVLDQFKAGKRTIDYLLFHPTESGVNVTLLSKDVNATMQQKSSSHVGGAVLKDDYWISREMDFAFQAGLTAGTILLTDHLMGFDVGIPLAKFSGDLFKTAVIAYGNQPFRNQVVIGGATVLTLVYGPSKVIDKSKEIIDNVIGSGPGIALLLLGGGLVLASSFKRQKLF